MKQKKRFSKRMLTFILAMTLTLSSLSGVGTEGIISHAAAAGQVTEESYISPDTEEEEKTEQESEKSDQNTGTEETDPSEPENSEDSGASESADPEKLTEIPTESVESTEPTDPEQPEEPEKEQRTLTIRCENSAGEPSETLSASSDPEELYAGTEVTITVTNSGTNIWAAKITAQGRPIQAEETENTLTFEMPNADVEVLVYEIESQNRGELSEEDSSIPGDFQGNQFHTKKDNEPDIELEKSARWTDIEDGYAELTITEKDTSDYSNTPTDYIIILDRTRTMALSEVNHEESAGQPGYMGYHSPCINPAHYYYKGGIYLHMLDYFTGYDYKHGVWFENLPGSFDFWNRHYNQNGSKIMPAAENGCYDRMAMAQQGIRELIDRIAAQNASVTGNALRSRIAFWSFADSYKYHTGDKRDQGLYNYTSLTDNYEQVKQAVNQVKTYSGTYYLASLQEAYDIITKRNATDSQRKNVYTKVIFISDGVCETDLPQVRSKAAQIQSLPNTELFTLAIGMTAEADGARLLREMAGSDDHTANFWQTLSFDGGKGSAFAKTLLNIEKKAIEVKATQKTITDQIETRYWDPVEIVSADGGQASLDKNTGTLTWKIPDGAGQTYRCTIKLRLKDAYRYELSDRVYPTNRDQDSSDPTKAGAVLDYRIDGGIYNQQTRKAGVLTPTLKYGTVQFTGRKNWMVSGSRADRITVRLIRTLPGQSTAVQVNNAVTNGSRNWRYEFTRRSMPDGSAKPLVKYDEKGRTVTYQVTEKVPDYYVQLDSVVTEGASTDTQLYNEPFKVKAELQKRDQENDTLLSGAEFSVYMWSQKKESYIPYRGTTDTESKPYESGTLTGATEGMVLCESQKGTYITPSWLYYAPDNQGKYRIIETQAPEGYYGDWKAEGEKHVYDITISPKASENKKTITISNREDGTFRNQRVLGEITFTKNDAEREAPLAQGDAALPGAKYKLYRRIPMSPKSGKAVSGSRDGEMKVRFVGSRDGVRIYRYDPSGTDTIIVGAGCQVRIENLELGSYYLQEVEAGEGYLVDPEAYEFTLEWQGEAVPVVKITDFQVYEQVKKQQLTFYKVAGTDKTDRLDPLAGAGFSIYLLSEFANGKYSALSDAEVVQAVIDDFRDPVWLDYRAVRAFSPAKICEEADSPEIKAGKLVKKLNYGDGYVYQTEQENEYLAGELFSDSQGRVTTPSLPYGRYLMIETTVPKDRIATRPFVVNVTGDDRDAVTAGDGQGKTLEDLVILQDRPVSALVRIEKSDSVSGKNVQKAGAAYVIHDTEGSWFSYYTAEWSSEQKKAYKETYGDLVVQYSQGTQLGTEKHPFTIRENEDAEGGRAFYVDTPSALPAGIYELQEVSAPDGYILQGQEGVIAKNKALTGGNQTFYETEETGAWKPVPEGRAKFIVSSSEAVYDSSARSFVVKVRQKNTPAIGKIAIYAEGEKLVSVREKDGAYSFGYENKPIQGAEFEIRAAEEIRSQEGIDGELLYKAGAVVATLVTDESGQTWTGQEDWEGTDIAKGLPLGSYEVVQTKAGEGFALSRENAAPRRIEITYAGQEVPVIYRDTAYQNPRQKVQIAIEKQDAETGRPVAGAVFGLYASENIDDYRGKTLVKKDTLLMQRQTFRNEEGKVERAVFSEDLPLGRYYVKELQAPSAYAGSAIRVNADATWRSDQREQINLKATVKNAPIRVQINLMDWFTEAELSGATLQLKDKTGKIIETFVTTADENPIIRGLEAGQTYNLTQVVKPAGYEEGLLLKQKYVTGKADSVELEKAYLTGKEETEVKFTVQDEAKLQVVSVFAKPGKGVLEITKNGPVPVRTVSGTDENGHVQETPLYEVMGLPGAEYVILARNEIAYPDGQAGILFAENDLVLEKYEAEKETGSMQYVTLEVPEGKGELVQAERTLPDGTKASLVLRTGKDGKAQVTGLPYGSYRIVEVKAPTGYYRDAAACTQMADVRGMTTVLFENPKQEIEKPGTDPAPDPNPDPDPSSPIGMLVQKYSIDGRERTEKAGAEFTLYAAEDVRNIFGDVIYPEGTEIETAISEKDGMARFVTDVPIGLYRIRETKAPEGYYSSKKEIVYNVAKDKDDDSVHYLNFYDFVENAPTVVNIRLQDDLTKNELAGAALEITDEAGKSVDAWITKIENGYTIRGLSVDKSYTITEKVPRDGYLVKFTGAEIESENAVLQEPEGQKVTFHIQDVPGEVTKDGHLALDSVPEMTRIILENAFVTGDVHLNKDGEILERQTLIHRLGKLFSAFDYKKTGLEGVEFAVYAAADIEHPDGVTGICFRKGEQVMTGVRSELKEAFGITDRVGELNFQELYLGQYEIRELKTAEGYVRDTEPLIFTLAYQDGYTSPVDPQQGRIAWTNPRQQVNVTITKRDAKTRGTLEGAEIGLYTAKDVRNAQGQLLIPADTLLELGRTDAEGKLFFASDVPFGSYYVKEVTAPEGYQLTEELQEFEFAYAGENTGIVEKNLTILNEKKPAKSGRTPQQTPPAATGDQAAPGLYLALLCAALFVMAYIRTELQRKKQKK